MRDITLRRFRGDRQIINKWSHLLNTELLNENRKICNKLWDAASKSLKQISKLDQLKENYKEWTGNRSILISNEFTIKEIYENFFSKLNFHENEKTNFEVVVQNLAAYARKFPERIYQFYLCILRMIIVKILEERLLKVEQSSLGWEEINMLEIIFLVMQFYTTII